MMARVRELVFHIYLLLSGSILCWATDTGHLNYQYPQLHPQQHSQQHPQEHPQQYQPEVDAYPYYAPDYYVGYGEPIDRQALEILQSGGVQAAQIGALVILGGAAIVTGITAVNNQRDYNTLKGNFQVVCNAVRAAGNVEVDPIPVTTTTTTTARPVKPKTRAILGQIPPFSSWNNWLRSGRQVSTADPVAQEALLKIDAVIARLDNVADSTCNF